MLVELFFLTFNILRANSDDKLIFILFFPEKKSIWHFPWETICMKCQKLVSGENKKKDISMSSDEKFT